MDECNSGETPKNNCRQFLNPCFSLSMSLFSRSSGWGEWTEWGDCDEEGLQRRTRSCGEDPAADAGLCRGNVTQSRPCQPHEVPGEHIFLFAELLHTIN